MQPIDSLQQNYRRLLLSLRFLTVHDRQSALMTASFGGTSSATPLVAAIAALTISANPDLSPLDVISTLKQTASKDLSMQGYPVTLPASVDLIRGTSRRFGLWQA